MSRVPALTAVLLFGLLAAGAAAPAAAQERTDSAGSVLTRPPDLRIEDVLDSLAGPDGRVKLGDVEFVVRSDPRAKGGLFPLITPWPDGVVPYVMDNCMLRSQQRLVREAMRRWEGVAPVRFDSGNGPISLLANHSRMTRDRLPDCGRTPAPTRDGVPIENYVRIQWHPTDNSSCMGMCGGEQVINLTDWAPSGVMLHELGHALGMTHEHVRSDRDRYVRVVTSNIENDKIHNFRKLPTENCTPYDFGSIMHYGDDFFSRSGGETLVPNTEYAGFRSRMGSRSDLSQSDMDDVRALYGAISCSQGGRPEPTPGVSGPGDGLIYLMTTGTDVPWAQVSHVPSLTEEGFQSAWQIGNIVTGAQTPAGSVIVAWEEEIELAQELFFNSPEWPSEWIRERWASDPQYRIRGVFGGSEGWTVIMNHTPSVYVPQAGASLENWGWSEQSTRIRERWDPEIIRSMWNDGMHITDLGWGPEGWAYVFSRGTRYGGQEWDIRLNPEDAIERFWADGYAITSLVFGEGRWHLVATRNAGINRQRRTRSATFPGEAIQEARDEGMMIQAIDYGNGFWYVIFSERP